MFKVTAIGNLARDPETRQVNTSTGIQSVVSFTLACNNGSRRSTQPGQPDDSTIFIRCSIWGNRGNVVMQYVKKGHKMAVTGSMSVPRTFTTRDGNTGIDLEMRVDDFDLLTSRAEAEAMAAAAPAQAYAAPASAAPQTPTAQNGAGFQNVMPDELPF